MYVDNNLVTVIHKLEHKQKCVTLSVRKDNIMMNLIQSTPKNATQTSSQKKKNELKDVCK